MSGKANIGGPEGDTAQEEILRKLEDTSAQRQIDIGGGVMVNAGQEDYGSLSSFTMLQYWGFKFMSLLWNTIGQKTPKYLVNIMHFTNVL